jgi:hypothetical protein
VQPVINKTAKNEKTTFLMINEFRGLVLMKMKVRIEMKRKWNGENCEILMKGKNN